MKKEDAIIYAELYDILKNMDKSIVMKIPMRLLNKIVNERDKNFISKVDKNDIFNPSNISERTCNLFSWIAYTYWANDSRKIKIQNHLKKFSVQN